MTDKRCVDCGEGPPMEGDTLCGPCRSDWEYQDYLAQMEYEADLDAFEEAETQRMEEERIHEED